jgi:uncharacterized protein
MVAMPFTDYQQQTLLQIAKNSIQNGLKFQAPLPVQIEEYSGILIQQRACFVTLNKQQQLRGCIGSLQAYRPLVIDISNNAYAAAFSDPRFPALQQVEFKQLEFHISILEPAEPMSFTSEEDLLSQIRPNIDGLILSDQGKKGTFLPSVWQSLTTTKDFWQQLKRKAGLPINHWSDTLMVERYSTESFSG